MVVRLALENLESYRPFLSKWAMKWKGNLPVEVDDLVQECMVEAIQEIKSGKIISGKPLRWLKEVLHNTILDAVEKFRAQKRDRAVTSTNTPEGRTIDVGDLSWEDKIHFNEELERVVLRMHRLFQRGKLSQKRYDALLHLLNGLTPTEMSKKYGGNADAWSMTWRMHLK